MPTRKRATKKDEAPEVPSGRSPAQERSLASLNESMAAANAAEAEIEAAAAEASRK